MNLQSRAASIKITGLDVSVGHRTLFRVRELDLWGGEILGISGPNGRGKTTLLRLIAGLARPAEGEIARHFSKQVPNEHLLYLASTPALLADQSVAENLEFYANVFGVLPSFADFDRVLLRTGLAGRAKQIVRSLSTGQKRRLSFSALDLVRPAILIADEPTNGLDQNGRDLCAELLSEAKNRGGLTLVATHDQALLQLCDRVLDVQQLLEDAAFEDSLRKKAGHEFSGAAGAAETKRKVTLL